MAVSGIAAAKRHRHAHRMSRRAIGAVIVVAVVLIGLCFALQGGATKISASRTVTLAASPSYFSIGSGIYSLSLAQARSGVAHVYVDKLPIFINSMLNVTLYQNNMTKVNSGSSFANIGLTLESVNGSSITVRITPLDTALQITPSTGRISAVNNLLLINNGNGTGTNSVTTTAMTTVTTVTTVAQTNTTHASIMTALNRNETYALMQNYSVIYANTQNCTQNLYNSAYISHYGYAPAGPTTYPNVSTFAPYGLYTNTTNLGKGNYSFAYSTRTVDPLYNNAQAVVIKVNISTARVSTVVFRGIFQDQSYTALLAGYSRAISIGGPCGIVVP